MARFTLATLVLALAAFATAAPVEQHRRSLEGRSSGQATWYTPSDGEGACGWYNSNSEKVVAVNSAQYKQGNCGKMVHIKSSGGKSVTAKIVDECPTCGHGDLDLSPATFKSLASMDEGVASISWSIE